jgi:hypothetical protein
MNSRRPSNVGCFISPPGFVKNYAEVNAGAGNRTGRTGSTLKTQKRASGLTEISLMNFASSPVSGQDTMMLAIEEINNNAYGHPDK